MLRTGSALSPRWSAAMLLAGFLLTSPSAAANAQVGEFEQAQVVATYGSGAALVRNAYGQTYGVVYLGMDGSQPSQDAFAGFHDYASRSSRDRLLGQHVRVAPSRVMGETPEGMLVLMGHLFLPYQELPVAADLLDSGLGWYHPDAANSFDGIFAQRESVARSSHRGMWGWTIPVPFLGPTPPPAAPPDFALRPVPVELAPAWDTLLESPDGLRWAEVVERTRVRFSLGDLRGSWAAYSPRFNLIWLDSGLAREDPRAAATVLAHEITHAEQPRLVDDDCVDLEAQAFAAQARLWAHLAGPAPPARTALEQQLNLLRAAWEEGGESALATLVREHAAYQAECGLAA